MPDGTNKQREFARLVAEGSTLADAYAEAYETSGKRETIRREATRLASNPTMAPLLRDANKAVEKALQPTKGSRKRWVLERLVNEAENGSDSSRIRALELLGKSVGAFDLESESESIGNESDLLASLRAKLASVLPEPIDVTPESETPDGEGGTPL